MKFLLEHVLQLVVVRVQMQHILVLIFEFVLVSLLYFDVVLQLLLQSEFHFIYRRLPLVVLFLLMLDFFIK